MDVSGATQFLVMQIAVASDGAAQAYLYLKLDLGSTPLTSTAIANVAFTAEQDLSFNRVRLENNGVNNIQDELRIGTTFAAVIPEPSSALLALAGLGSFLLRRNRRNR